MSFICEQTLLFHCPPRSLSPCHSVSLSLSLSLHTHTHTSIVVEDFVLSIARRVRNDGGVAPFFAVIAGLHSFAHVQDPPLFLTRDAKSDTGCVFLSGAVVIERPNLGPIYEECAEWGGRGGGGGEGGGRQDGRLEGTMGTKMRKKGEKEEDERERRRTRKRGTEGLGWAQPWHRGRSPQRQ
jgi:hypothetical protein